jgi:hypothetical protein
MKEITERQHASILEGLNAPTEDRVGGGNFTGWVVEVSSSTVSCRTETSQRKRVNRGHEGVWNKQSMANESSPGRKDHSCQSRRNCLIPTGSKYSVSPVLQHTR